MQQKSLNSRENPDTKGIKKSSSTVGVYCLDNSVVVGNSVVKNKAAVKPLSRNISISAELIHELKASNKLKERASEVSEGRLSRSYTNVQSSSNSKIDDDPGIKRTVSEIVSNFEKCMNIENQPSNTRASGSPKGFGHYRNSRSLSSLLTPRSKKQVEVSVYIWCFTRIYYCFRCFKT